MVNYLHQQQLEHMWSDGTPGEGVILKKSRDQYTSCPAELSQYEGGFFDAARKLNVKVSPFENFLCKEPLSLIYNPRSP